MSGSESPTLMNPGDEIWTEEEVIEFGLAGEEDYCDLETVETTIDIPTMPEVTETAELVYLDDAESALLELDTSSTKKSGRVRTICLLVKPALACLLCCFSIHMSMKMTFCFTCGKAQVIDVSIKHRRQHFSLYVMHNSL